MSNASDVTRLTAYCDGWPIEAGYDDVKGKYLKARSDISCGQVVLLSAPYATALLPSYKKRVCSFCLQDHHTRLQVCCGSCNQAWYCSEACREAHAQAAPPAETARHGAAWVPHALVCPALKSFSSTKCDADMEAVLRMVLNVVAMEHLAAAKEVSGANGNAAQEAALGRVVQISGEGDADDANLAAGHFPPLPRLGPEDFRLLQSHAADINARDKRDWVKGLQFVVAALQRAKWPGSIPTVNELMDVLGRITANNFGVWLDRSAEAEPTPDVGFGAGQALKQGPMAAATIAESGSAQHRSAHSEPKQARPWPALSPLADSSGGEILPPSAGSPATASLTLAACTARQGLPPQMPAAEGPTAPTSQLKPSNDMREPSSGGPIDTVGTADPLTSDQAGDSLPGLAAEPALVAEGSYQLVDLEADADELADLAAAFSSDSACCGAPDRAKERRRQYPQAEPAMEGGDPLAESGVLLSRSAVLCGPEGGQSDGQQPCRGGSPTLMGIGCGIAAGVRGLFGGAPGAGAPASDCAPAIADPVTLRSGSSGWEMVEPLEDSLLPGLAVNDPSPQTGQEHRMYSAAVADQMPSCNGPEAFCAPLVAIDELPLCELSESPAQAENDSAIGEALKVEAPAPKPDPACGAASPAKQRIGGAGPTQGRQRAVHRDELLGRQLFITASLFNHSCAPNCLVSRGPGLGTVTALQDIKAGEELCISYIDLQLPRSARRDALKAGFFFDCCCPRCEAELKDGSGKFTYAKSIGGKGAPNRRGRKARVSR